MKVYRGRSQRLAASSARMYRYDGCKATIYTRGAICVEADRMATVVADPSHESEAFAEIAAVETLTTRSIWKAGPVSSSEQSWQTR